MSLRLVVDNDRNWSELSELHKLRELLNSKHIEEFLRLSRAKMEKRNANPTAATRPDDSGQRRD